jgi:hypothetical protein
MELEEKNATGIENPLAVYTDSYNKIPGVFGFMGCYTTSTVVITN